MIVKSKEGLRNTVLSRLKYKKFMSLEFIIEFYLFISYLLKYLLIKASNLMGFEI
jgi:hypothetical protein